MTYFINKAPKAVRPFVRGGGGKIATFRVEKMFFDRAHVQERIGKANAAALSRAGAYIKQRAKTRILKRRKKPSAPGQPPHVHAPQGEKTRTLRNIDFKLDRDWESLVVGPYGLAPRSINSPTHKAGYTVPQILEHGGSIQFVEEKPMNTANVDYDWRREGVYDNPARRASPKKRRKFAKGRRRKSKKRWKPLAKGSYKKNQPMLRRTRRARIAKRPFMAVALREEIKAGIVAKSWKSSVIGARE